MCSIWTRFSLEKSIGEIFMCRIFRCSEFLVDEGSMVMCTQIEIPLVLILVE
jgi:hypothetical protein